MSRANLASPPPHREMIVDKLFELFRNGGFDGVSISDIGNATGLGKSSLYHHFPGGKDEMAAAVLGKAADWFGSEVVKALLEPGASREQRVDGMLSALDGLYCGGAKPCIFASMLLGGAAGRINESVTAGFRAWHKSLARALAETGLSSAEAAVRSTSAIVQIEGSLILSRALEDPSIFKRSLRSVRDLLLG